MAHPKWVVLAVISHFPARSPSLYIKIIYLGMVSFSRILQVPSTSGWWVDRRDDSGSGGVFPRSPFNSWAGAVLDARWRWRVNDVVVVRAALRVVGSRLVLSRVCCWRNDGVGEEDTRKKWKDCVCVWRRAVVMGLSGSAWFSTSVIPFFVAVMLACM